MEDLSTPTSIRSFFNEIYYLLKDTDKSVNEIWYEPSDIKALSDLNKYELNEFLMYFDFVNR